MKIKRSLVVLVVVLFFCLAVPVVAHALALYPERVPASETMDFTPLLYIIELLSVVLLCLVVVALVEMSKLRAKQKLIGRGTFDLNAAASDRDSDYSFDYREIETPDEFSGYSEQSILAMKEAVSRIGEKKDYVPKHLKKQEEAAVDAPVQPRIRLVPEMKHARRKAVYTASYTEVPAELEELLRKIS